MSHIIMINPEQPDEDCIRIAVEALHRGGILIYPTETVYGLGVDFNNEQAIMDLYRVKQRDEAKPFSFIAADREMVRDYVEDVSGLGRKLMDRFWPGPLTIVFSANANVNPLLLGGTAAIGMRVPDNILCRTLVQQFGRPITSTSANLSGEKECRTIEQIPGALKSAAEVILDGGETRGVVPSTVISIAVDPPEILREGAVSPNLIEDILEISFP